MASKKIVIIGDSNVGKTIIVSTYVIEKPMEVAPTIGAAFHISTKFQSGGKFVSFWDTAGQERYRSVCPIYYKGSSAAVCVFDVTNRDSFDNLPKWIETFRQHTEENAPILIVGNKIDCGG